MQIRKYVLYIYTNGWMDGWMYGWMDDNGWMYVSNGLYICMCR